LHAASWRFAYRGALSDEYLAGPIDEERLGVWLERLSEASANRFVVVAEEESQMAGFACAFGERDDRWGTLLDNLHVRREWQGKGIGRSLVAEVAKWCAKRNPDSGLYLSVLEQNARAQGFTRASVGQPRRALSGKLPVAAARSRGDMCGRKRRWLDWRQCSQAESPRNSFVNR
ncbi:MAG: GNAT family N-acetyltransferase, partial [Chloroflexota bacterium]